MHAVLPVQVDNEIEFSIAVEVPGPLHDVVRIVGESVRGVQHLGATRVTQNDSRIGEIVTSRLKAQLVMPESDRDRQRVIGL